MFLFLTHNFHEGKSGATIASLSSAIAYVHKITGHRDPTNTQAIRKLIVSAQKKAPSIDVRCPINSFILKNLVSDLSSFCQNYDKIMLEALFLTLFHGFFRVGELVARTKAQSHKVVQLADLSFDLRSSKPHWCRILLCHAKNAKPGEIFHVSLSSRANLCPVTSLHTFVKLRGSHEGPLFAYPGGEGLLRAQFTKFLNLSLQKIGLEPSRYKGHSFRIGAATEAAAAGKTDADIRSLGRWRSDAFKNMSEYTLCNSG